MRHPKNVLALRHGRVEAHKGGNMSDKKSNRSQESHKQEGGDVRQQPVVMLPNKNNKIKLTRGNVLPNSIGWWFGKHPKSKTEWWCQTLDLRFYKNAWGGRDMKLQGIKAKVDNDLRFTGFAVEGNLT